jgi:hypothetical protein
MICKGYLNVFFLRLSRKVNNQQQPLGLLLGETFEVFPMKGKERFYIKFVKEILAALKRGHVRRFPHKHDPKKVGVWANTCLLALRSFEDKSYRFVVEFVSLMPDILTLLQLENIPHFTTLQKAAARLGDAFVKKLVASFVKATKSLKIRAGIDATGLQPTSASVYYTKVLAKDGKKRRKIKKHLKLSTVVDLSHQMPICYKVRRGPASDHLDCNALIRKAYRIKPFKSFDGDKGYTGEEHRRIIVEECHAEDRIKVKNAEVPIWRTKGEYLKKAKRKKLRANYRALNETYHSVLKKITGSCVRAIKVKMQNLEISFKVLACSAYRRAKCLFYSELFY